MDLRILILEDEAPAARRLKSQLESLDSVTVVGIARTGDEALELAQRLSPNLAMLDVQVPGQTGLDVAREILPECEIVFVSAHDRFAVDAFGIAAVDYLLKPTSVERISTALDRVRAKLRLLRSGVVEPSMHGSSEGKGDFWISDRGGLTRISASKVRWFEAERDYVKIHTEDRYFLLRDTLQNLHTRLPSEEFTRVSRSAIVRIADIARIERTPGGRLRLVLGDGTRVPVGVTYKKFVDDILARSIQNRSHRPEKPM